MGRTDLVIASNRGPLSFSRDSDGELVPTRGAGGLVSSVGPLVEGTGATWVAAAMSDEDREAVAENDGAVEAEGYRLRALDLDPTEYRQYYDVISNATLWFLHHGLYDLARSPRFDRRWREAWEGYRAVNRQFAEAVADEAPDDGIVLVQDYHLSLVPKLLKDLRPDVRSVHFSHTPFADPSTVTALPTAAELIEGLAAADACGFHAARWQADFEGCCSALGISAPRTFVAPIAPDPDDIGAVAESPECAEQAAWVTETVGARRMILRVDRIELSKNIVRGFQAYELLLDERPDLHDKVVFVALVYPSRQSLPQYQAYRQEVETVVERVNNRFGTDTWQPVVYDGDDNFPRSVAALKRYDVLLVNPVRDGLNLVAKEGPLVNQCEGVVALSREAGVWDELSSAALGLNPFDIAETADVLAGALDMAPSERSSRSSRLKELATARKPEDWLDDQLRALAEST